MQGCLHMTKISARWTDLYLCTISVRHCSSCRHPPKDSAAPSAVVRLSYDAPTAPLSADMTIGDPTRAAGSDGFCVALKTASHLPQLQLRHRGGAQRGLNPPGVVFPVSAAILDRIEDYRRTLESWLARLLPFIHWEPTPTGNVRRSKAPTRRHSPRIPTGSRGAGQAARPPDPPPVRQPMRAGGRRRRAQSQASAPPF